MGTMPHAFPDIRIWIIVNNLNQRVHRAREWPPVSKPRKSWNQASRRMRRYLLHRFESTSTPRLLATRLRNAKQIPTQWKLNMAMLIRSLRRNSHELESRWQRRIFQILETGSSFPKPKVSYRSRAWQVCFQVLTSHNHFRKPASVSITRPAEPTWQHTLWRAGHLKKRAMRATVIPPSWAICFCIVLADNLRSRTHGWHKRLTNILQCLNVAT
jgi:hypothetical protein